MTEKEESKPVDLSDESRLFVERYPLIEEARTRFWNEWRRILLEIANKAKEAGYVTKIQGDAQSHKVAFQAAKGYWPQPFENAIHLQITLDISLLYKGECLISLDIEEGTPAKEKIQEALRRILTSYEQCGRLMSETKLSLNHNSKWRILGKYIPLRDLGLKQLYQAFSCCYHLRTAIDEALFIGPSCPMWRCDLFETDGRPDLKFKDKVGHQKYVAEEGLMGSPAITINGRLGGNYKEIDDQPSNIMILGDFRDLQMTEEIYLSCIVRSKKGGRIWFHGAGSQVLPDKDPQWIPVFKWEDIRVRPSQYWQHIGRHARICFPEDFEYDKGRLQIYLTIQTEDENFLINSIEFGKWEGK